MLSMTEPPILLLALRGEEQRGQYALQLSTSVASGYVEHFPGREPAADDMLIPLPDWLAGNGSIFV